MDTTDFEVIELDTISLGERSDSLDVESDIAALEEEENDEVLREQALATMEKALALMGNQGRDQGHQNHQHQHQGQQEHRNHQHQGQQGHQGHQQQHHGHQQHQQYELPRGFLRLQQNNMRDLREVVEARKLNRLLANDFDRRRRFMENCRIPGRRLFGMYWWQDMGNGRFARVDRV